MNKLINDHQVYLKINKTNCEKLMIYIVYVCNKSYSNCIE